MTYNPDTATAQSINVLNDVGTLALTDITAWNRNGVDYKGSIAALASLIRRTPAGSRVTTLPATLTASDHDRNVLLTGTAGNLSVDGTVTDGFRCFVFNNASGAATYSGIVGGYATTALPSGAATLIAMAGGTIIAAPPPTASTTTAVAYTSALSSTAGGVGTPVSLTFTPTAGVWPNAFTMTLSQTGGTGTFASATLSPPANSSAPIITTFTPSSANTFTFSSSPSPSMTNTTGTLSYTSSASTASTYSMRESVTVGLVGNAVTLTFAPAGGSWPASTTITPAVAGVAGTLSPTTLSPTGIATVTCTFTPSAAGAATISASNNQGLGNPPNLSYQATAVAASYTQTLSATSGAVGAAVTLTLTPISGGWPSGETLTPNVSPNSGVFSPTSQAPQVGSTAAVVFTFTPNSTGTFTLNTSTTPAMTNATGGLSYTANAVVANSYSTAISATSGQVGAPVTLTYSPISGVWPAGETINPSSSPNTGVAFSFSSFTPQAGTNTPLTGTFTPSAPGNYAIISSASPSMTSTVFSVAYAATNSVASYPTISTSGATVLSIIDANAGVTSSNGLITSVADQSVNGNNLTATAGVSVGANVNGLPGFAFNSASYSGCSGLRTSAPWLANLAGPHTIAFAFKTGATVPQNATLINMEPASLNYSNDLVLLFVDGALKWWIRPGWQDCIILPAASVTPNTVYKLILRTSGYSFDYWLNGGAKVAGAGNQVADTLASANFALGQAASSGASSLYSLFGFTGGEILEMHAIKGALSDADVASYQSYLSSKWGS